MGTKTHYEEEALGNSETAITISFSVAIRVPELNVWAEMLLGNRTSAIASCLRDNGGARALSCSLGFFS